MAALPASPLKCFCGRVYSTPLDLQEHRRARGHFEAHVCGDRCKHPPVTQHPLRIQQCNYCGKICEREDIMQDHRVVTGHCFCSECNVTFSSQTALKRHQQTEIHASEFRCCNCNISFADIHALNAHMASRAHRKPRDTTVKKPKCPEKILSVENTRCKDCRRNFKSAQSLQQHRASIKHKPLSDLVCPLGEGCRQRFSSPSALIQHLEGGTCRSGMDREKISHLIQRYDSDSLIHTPPRTLSYPISESSFETERILDNSSSDWSLIMSPSSLDWSLVDGSQASSEEWASIDVSVTHELQCQLCPKKRKSFATVQALQQHMNSPVHCARIYHCPTDMLPKISPSKRKTEQKYFSTLGGLAQHLESGACQGGKETFKKIIDFIERRLEQLGFGGMVLLLSDSHVT